MRLRRWQALKQFGILAEGGLVIRSGQCVPPRVEERWTAAGSDFGGRQAGAHLNAIACGMAMQNGCIYAHVLLHHDALQT